MTIFAMAHNYKKIRNMTHDYPTWVLQHKVKGTEIRTIKGRYYLYQVKSYWDKESKRSKKVTEAFLGRITETGLIKGKKTKKVISVPLSSSYCVQEYGIVKFLYDDNIDVLNIIKEHFEQIYESIFVAAINRFAHHLPLKNMEHYHTQSYSRELFPNAQMSDKLLSQLLLTIGRQRGLVTKVMQHFTQGKHFLLMDATQVLSMSSTLESAQIGYNASGGYDPHINLMYLFSTDAQLPVFYRLVPGNVREVSAMALTIKESQVKNAVIVADKGFYSKINIKQLDDEKLQYIIPLKRSSKLIDYTPMETKGRKGFTNFLQYNERIIWYSSIQINDNQRVILFLDEDLQRNEQKDYLARVEKNLDQKPEKQTDAYTLENYHLKAQQIGTIALLTNLDPKNTPQQIYEFYKCRAAVEILFDTFKNILFADVTYTRSNEALEGWLFINHIALIFYYRLYKRLLQHNLLKKYSPKDILMHLNTIKRVKINQNWVIAEIPTKSKTVLEKIEIPMAYQ
jgi:transposase